MNYDIIKSVGESICKTKDEFCAADSIYALDTIIDSIDLPIVNLIKGISNLGLGIRERNLCRNTVYFLQGFQSEDVDLDKLQEYKECLQSDQEFYEREITRIIVILDNAIDAIRARIIGCLYMNMINGRINHEQFCEYSDLTNRLYLSDFLSIVESDGEAEKLDNHIMSRFSGLGILELKPEFHIDIEGGHLLYQYNYLETQFGNRYRELISNIVAKYR